MKEMFLLFIQRKIGKSCFHLLSWLQFVGSPLLILCTNTFGQNWLVDFLKQQNKRSWKKRCLHKGDLNCFKIISGKVISKVLFNYRILTLKLKFLRDKIVTDEIISLLSFDFSLQFLITHLLLKTFEWEFSLHCMKYEYLYTYRCWHSSLI